jgi:hypothetical protein
MSNGNSKVLNLTNIILTIMGVLLAAMIGLGFNSIYNKIDKSNEGINAKMDAAITAINSKMDAMDAQQTHRIDQTQAVQREITANMVSIVKDLARIDANQGARLRHESEKGRK